MKKISRSECINKQPNTISMPEEVEWDPVFSEIKSIVERLKDIEVKDALRQALEKLGAKRGILEVSSNTLNTSTSPRVVYVGMSADIVHHGHANIIRVANEIKASHDGSQLVVGLLSDEAIMSYKRKPIVPWEQRRKLIEAFKGVDTVVPQNTLDYRPNLRTWRPAFVVHGSDWAEPSSAQFATRQLVIDTLAEWGGGLVEPSYTTGISTSEIINEIACRVQEDGTGL